MPCNLSCSVALQSVFTARHAVDGGIHECQMLQYPGAKSDPMMFAAAGCRGICISHCIPAGSHAYQHP